jgi:DMSO/TMAO reductase YedYZ heme-binding membrane subunit
MRAAQSIRAIWLTPRYRNTLGSAAPGDRSWPNTGTSHLIWPWQDRKRGFSLLKASTFILMFAPAVWLDYQLATKQFGPAPIGGLTYWSGLWATALLLVALAITPALTIFRWNRLIVVRRMLGVAGLAYTIAHIAIYFWLRRWNFASSPTR